MPLFENKPTIKALYLREDYKVKVRNIQVDEMASDVLTISKDGRRQFSWFLIHQLLKPIYGFPGIPDGTRCLLICSRDVRFDPLHELDKSWDNENIRKKMLEIAKEQQFKVDQSHGMGLLNRSMVLLSASAAILVLSVVIIGVLKYLAS